MIQHFVEAFLLDTPAENRLLAEQRRLFSSSLPKCITLRKYRRRVLRLKENCIHTEVCIRGSGYLAGESCMPSPSSENGLRAFFVSPTPMIWGVLKSPAEQSSEIHG